MKKTQTVPREAREPAGLFGLLWPATEAWPLFTTGVGAALMTTVDGSTEGRTESRHEIP
jgi:hypothetical protein